MTLFWNKQHECIKNLEKQPLKTQLAKQEVICNHYHYVTLAMRCSKLRQHLFDMNIILVNTSATLFLSLIAPIYSCSQAYLI